MGLENTVSMGASGASIGSVIAPGIGTIIGGSIGAGIGFVTDLVGGSNSASAREIQAKSNLLTYQTAALQTGTKIDETKANIGAYESFVSAFPNYMDLQKATFEQQAQNEFRGLLGNFAATQNASGVTGRTGGSAALVSEQARGDLVAYAGADNRLTADGIYGMAKADLNQSLDAQQRQASDQLGILKTSLGTLTETLGLYQNAVVDAQGQVKSAQDAEKSWWNPFD